MFKSHDKIRKTYWAIVESEAVRRYGYEAMRLENYLLRNEKQNKSFVVKPGTKEAKYAALSYKVVAQSERYTLLEINLETGRHHQIRCQLAAIGCPIKGDLKYGAKRSNPDGGISLHARKIEFVHPVSKLPIAITAPVPNDTLWHALEKDAL
jgi:23S rRNA pseudouridine1911/1915/1917 synthase